MAKTFIIEFIQFVNFKKGIFQWKNSGFICKHLLYPKLHEEESYKIVTD